MRTILVTRVNGNGKLSKSTVYRGIRGVIGRGRLRTSWSLVVDLVTAISQWLFSKYTLITIICIYRFGLISDYDSRRQRNPVLINVDQFLVWWIANTLEANINVFDKNRSFCFHNGTCVRTFGLTRGCLVTRDYWLVCNYETANARNDIKCSMLPCASMGSWLCCWSVLV